MYNILLKIFWKKNVVLFMDIDFVGLIGSEILILIGLRICKFLGNGFII